MPASSFFVRSCVGDAVSGYDFIVSNCSSENSDKSKSDCEHLAEIEAAHKVISDDTISLDFIAEASVPTSSGREK